MVGRVFQPFNINALVVAIEYAFINICTAMCSMCMRPTATVLPDRISHSCGVIKSSDFIIEGLLKREMFGRLVWASGSVALKGIYLTFSSS